VQPRRASPGARRSCKGGGGSIDRWEASKGKQRQTGEGIVVREQPGGAAGMKRSMGKTADATAKSTTTKKKGPAWGATRSGKARVQSEPRRSRRIQQDPKVIRASPSGVKHGLQASGQQIKQQKTGALEECHRGIDKLEQREPQLVPRSTATKRAKWRGGSNGARARKEEKMQTRSARREAQNGRARAIARRSHHPGKSPKGRVRGKGRDEWGRANAASTPEKTRSKGGPLTAAATKKRARAQRAARAAVERHKKNTPAKGAEEGDCGWKKKRRGAKGTRIPSGTKVAAGSQSIAGHGVTWRKIAKTAGSQTRCAACKKKARQRREARGQPGEKRNEGGTKPTGCTTTNGKWAARPRGSTDGRKKKGKEVRTGAKTTDEARADHTKCGCEADG